jgi:small subunit ribosomal protein S2
LVWWIPTATPTKVDFAIPANDDAATSIALITNYIADAIAEGLAERTANAEGSDQSEEEDNL